MTVANDRYNANPKGRTWNDSLAALMETMDKWGCKDFRWVCPMSDQPGRGSNHWSMQWGNGVQAQVTIFFTHPRDGERSLSVSKFSTPRDNLWALALGLEDIRLNERRGLDSVAREFYQALPAPKEPPKRNPWEVLGLGPGSSLQAAETMFTVLAKVAHPDHGGTTEAMAELNEAIATIRKEGV